MNLEVLEDRLVPAPVIAPQGDLVYAQRCFAFGLSRTVTFTDASPGPWNVSVDYGDGTAPKNLTVNTQSFNLSYSYKARSVYEVKMTVTNSVNETGDASFLVATNRDLPQVQPNLITINDGNAQRSMVNSITVTLPTVYQVQPGAVTVTDDATATTVPVRQIVRNISGQTVVFLQFPSYLGGSLKDGNYHVTVNGSLLVDGANNPFDSGNSTVQAFFRLFGDSNGDHKVNSVDLSAFQASLRSLEYTSPYRWYFDIELDGDIDATDYNQFIARYNKQ